MIPVSADELEALTPASLANLPAPPVIRLRPATERTTREYRRALRREGLVYHQPDVMRDEITRALKELWSEEAFTAQQGRLNSYWAALDQKVEVDPAEAAAIGDLVDRVEESWPPLRRMAAQNAAFIEDSLKIAATLFVVGWSNLDVPFRREEGVVPLSCIDGIEAQFANIERKALDDKVEGIVVGLSFMELLNACASRLDLAGQEEKNSASPPPSSAAPSGSTKKRSARTAAAGSKASASSRKAPRG